LKSEEPGNIQEAYENSLHFDGYAVAVLDIQGQSEALKKLEVAFDPRRMTPEVLAAIRSTFGAVKTLGEGIRKAVDSTNRANIDNKVIAAERHEEFAAATQDSLVCQTFGDTVVLYQALNSVAVPVHGIHALLRTCSIVMLGCLADCLPLRGGIELGLAAEIRPGELYGPAFLSAHALESKIAEYPRIVVGKTLPAYLRWVRESAPHNPAGRLAQLHADKCLSLLGLDSDDRLILDYLNAWFLTAGISQTRPRVKAAYEFATREADRWKREGNATRAEAYIRLAKYFESRAGVWLGCIVPGLAGASSGA